MKDTQARDIHFTAADNHTLTGSIFTANKAPHTALLLNSGTAIPRGFYAKFAHFSASQGFVVMTYDYRGIGDSAPANLQDSTARYRDWGQYDVAAAIKTLTDEYPTLPLTVVGHSTGGQQLGLANNAGKVKAAAFVSVSTGYWAGMFTKMKWLTLFLWKVYVPMAAKLYGYVPVKKLGLGENLPSGVAKEWASWCLEPSYLAAFLDNTGHRTSVDKKAFGQSYFETLNCPIKNYNFTDDDIATRKNVPPLMALFSNAAIDQQWISPSDVDQKQIGHLGLFRAQIGETLWLPLLEDLYTNSRSEEELIYQEGSGH